MYRIVVRQFHNLQSDVPDKYPPGTMHNYYSITEYFPCAGTLHLCDCFVTTKLGFFVDFFKFSPENTFIDFREEGGERGRETLM